MAKGFKSGGRKKGTKNRISVLRKKALAATEIGPIEFMLGVMRASEADPRLRLDAAKGAAQFLFAKPGTPNHGADAKLISAAATTSDAVPLTNIEWLLQLHTERATEVIAGRSTDITDQIIGEIERRVAAGIGDKPTDFIPDAPALSPEEEALHDRKAEDWADTTKATPM
jgi:hypothetical protein